MKLPTVILVVGLVSLGPVGCGPEASRSQFVIVFGLSTGWSQDYVQ